MKYLGKISLSLLAMLSIWACQKQPTQTVTEEKKAPLPTFMDSVSYAYGVSIGKDFQNNKIEGMNGEFIGKGILAVTDTTDSLLLSEQDSKAVIQAFAQQLQEEQQRIQAEKDAKAKEEGIAFLETNKKRPGVITLASGLQYEVITEGTGTKPLVSDKVKVHYHGTLVDGTVFDSSVERGQPATFGLQQVIPGWTEILQLMPTGSKWKVYIPQEKAYGARAAGSIPAFSTLIFDIDLLEIVSAQPAVNPNAPR
jgi:FKBP-type peptidyl-prolyl cis-trans isomerase FklB